MQRTLGGIARLDAHHRVACALVAAGITGVALHSHPLWIISLATYDAFAFVCLLLIAIAVALTSCAQVRALAQKQDAGRTIIFALVVIATCAAVFAVAFLIHEGKPDAQRHFTLNLLLALTTVILSWLLMHSVFGLRYAHNFYGDNLAKKCGGLQFPGEELPDYRDFTYFSFVIGMTCQVSDVQVTSREMRRLVLLHGVLSFAFNTIILALTINTVSSLL
ncbi:MAG: DUF1345 domain-containing protein [Verrucomicrobia bacterium]|nr:DUF1345 domain-containing protein [Verrucomicrobiota bacterium]